MIHVILEYILVSILFQRIERTAWGTYSKASRPEENLYNNKNSKTESNPKEFRIKERETEARGAIEGSKTEENLYNYQKAKKPERKTHPDREMPNKMERGVGGAEDSHRRFENLDKTQ